MRKILDHHDEEGASAVFIVLTLFVLLGAGALAVDAGSLWMTKRNFVADTDAAALASAMHAAESSCDTVQTQAEAQDYLAHNQGGSVSGTTDVAVDCIGDTVTVEFTGQAPMVFAGALGFSQLDVFASSTASFDIDALGQLRPLATCVTNPIVDVPLLGLGEAAPSVVVSFSGKDDDLAAGCGTPSGNWGWLCFADNCGSNDDVGCDDASGTSGFLRCGADPGLDIGAAPTALGPPYLSYEAHDEDCFTGATATDWCQTKPGSKSALTGGGKNGTPVDAAFEAEVFPILLVDQYAVKGGRTEVHPKGLLWVRFDGYCVSNSTTRNWSGDPKDDCKGDNFAFAFTPLFTQWSADDVLPDYVLEHVPVDVSLCGVDHDPDGGHRC